jgi:methionyl-tRNA synthetase
MKKTYVTTSIPYVNGAPHVGFALELVQADAIARYRKLLGEDVRLQTGADENAYKNVLSAQEAGVETAAFVAGNSEVFRRLSAALNVEIDDFLRTTEQRHVRAVQALWRKLRKEDLYQREYSGLYCTGCEDFYLERDLVAGLCPDHGTQPLAVEEKNYFFRLSEYQPQIEELLRSRRINIVPEVRRNEVLRFVERGLQDISISRSARRLQGWGIAVPGDEDQRVYVWIDALINYLSGPGFGIGEDWQEWWNDETQKIHVIGKNVWKFHAVYWPALLLSAGLELPDEIVVHGFLTENGEKISKSRGRSIDPFAFVERFGAEALRYYLLRGVPSLNDGDFSAARLQALYNADLANGLGNLVSRLSALGERAGCAPLGDVALGVAPQGYSEALDIYAFDRALSVLWLEVGRLNRAIEQAKPWEQLQRGEKVDALVEVWLRDLYRLAHWLRPFLPQTSERIGVALRQEPLLALRNLFPRIK